MDFSTAWLEWNTLDQVLLWLPLLLLSTDKIIGFLGTSHKIKSGNYFSEVTVKNKKFYLWCSIYILSVTFSFFAGHLQSFYYLFIVIVSYLFARWMLFYKKSLLVYLFLILFVCFLLISSIQWIPTLQFLFQSARNTDQLNNWQQAGWFMPWQNLIQFIAPDFFGNPATLNYWGIWNYGEFIGYIGIFPLIMAMYALFFRRDKKTLFFGTFFFLSLIFSLPTFFAKIPYILQIPFLATSQPTRLLLITDFSLAVLAALGLDNYLNKWKKD